MAILRDILGESSAYYRDMEKRVLVRLAELPLGSVLKRRIGRGHYYYLKVRRGAKVEARYLGKRRPEALEREIQERRLLKSQLREVQKSLALLSRLDRRGARR